MRKIILFLFLCFSVSFVFAQEWEKYKSEDLAFVAYFPETPKRSVQKVDTAVGELDMNMVMYTPINGDENAVYSIIRSDYPKSQFKNTDESYNSQVLDGAVSGEVTNVNGTLVFDNKVQFNGYPGRSIKIKIDFGYIYINAYLVENTMFISQVICSTDNDQNSLIKQFLDSFEIIKTK